MYTWEHSSYLYSMPPPFLSTPLILPHREILTYAGLHWFSLLRMKTCLANCLNPCGFTTYCLYSPFHIPAYFRRIHRWQKYLSCAFVSGWGNTSVTLCALNAVWAQVSVVVSVVYIYTMKQLNMSPFSLLRALFPLQNSWVRAIRKHAHILLWSRPGVLFNTDPLV